MKTFDELVALLPVALPRPEAPHPGVAVLMSPSERFVPPNFSETRSIEEGASSVILIAAAAAVGKTTVGTALSARTSAAYWDLSTFQVGNNSFLGTLALLYPASYPTIRSALVAGTGFIILDGLDETEVRSGRRNFDAFVEDLAAQMVSPRTRPSVVLLGRLETMEWIGEIFAERGVPYAEFRIDFFDRQQAETFIDASLDAERTLDSRPKAHRVHRQSFQGTRDEALNLICHMLGSNGSITEMWEEPHVRSFLGYAPVLDALTRFLDVGDWHALEAELRRVRTSLQAPGSVRPGDLLISLIERILEREQPKVAEHVSANLSGHGVAGDAIANLYSPREQLIRTLGGVFRLACDEPGRGLGPSARQIYEQLIGSQVLQHPFRTQDKYANVVFEEYNIAWCLLDGPTEMRRHLVDTLAARGYRPSHILASCFHALGVRDHGGDHRTTASSLGVLYDSMTAQFPGQQTPFLTVESTPEGIVATFLNASHDGKTVPSLLVHLDGDEPIRFSNGLANSVVVLPGEIELGRAGGSFVLGPTTHVFCGHLSCRAASIDVRGKGEDQAVTLRAGGASTSTETDLRVLDPNGVLAISWQSAMHPWAAFQEASLASGGKRADPTRVQVLRKFASMFLRQNSRNYGTVMRHRWSPEESDLRDELVELALKRGVLTRDQDVVLFSSEYRSLCSIVSGKGTFTPTVRGFVFDYLRLAPA